MCLRSTTEDCLVLICCGLYDLLRGILLLLPDLMLEEVMDKLIQPEALIVLVNHSSPLIQQGVMKVSSDFYRLLWFSGILMMTEDNNPTTAINSLISNGRFTKNPYMDRRRVAHRIKATKMLISQ